MPTKAREYVSTAGLADLLKCQATLAEVTRYIREQFHSQQDDRRATFFGRILLSEVDVQEECLSLPEISQFSGGVFPVLWLNFTFDPTRVGQDELRSLETEFSLQLLGEVESDRLFR